MTPTRRKFHRTLVGLALLAGLAGCATLPPPNQEFGVAQATIAGAGPAATQYAPGEMAAARAELADAQAAMTRENYDRARPLIAAAQADADLARAKGRALSAQAQAATKARDNDDLRRRLLDQEPLP
ncbi:MAG: DUF4398 domain-containing protein [Proteobacteria bacterium]|nr:DUF4398 domain-containing protein [Pseudomonadota bacterium]